MRNKRGIVLLLCIILCLLNTISVSAKEMKIHVIRLTDSNGNLMDHGEAVLLESRGEFLLMDTGSSKSHSCVISYLRRKKVKKLNIYISHMHGDHTGGLGYLTSDKHFKIDKIYLPAKKYGASEPSVKKAFKTISAQKCNAKLVYLNVGSSLSVGDAQIKILGPIGTYDYHKMTLNDYKNAYSLTAMVVCGKAKYLTAGDITKAEEACLIRKYHKKLRAQIMKVSHHGNSLSTSQRWVDTVQPRYAFVSNRGIDAGVNAILKEYAKVKVTGLEKKSFVYVVKNGKITVKTAS